MRAHPTETAPQETVGASRRVVRNRDFVEAVHLSITQIASFIGAFGMYRTKLRRNCSHFCKSVGLDLSCVCKLLKNREHSVCSVRNHKLPIRDNHVALSCPLCTTINCDWEPLSKLASITEGNTISPLPLCISDHLTKHAKLRLGLKLMLS